MKINHSIVIGVNRGNKLYYSSENSKLWMEDHDFKHIHTISKILGITNLSQDPRGRYLIAYYSNKVVWKYINEKVALHVVKELERLDKLYLKELEND